MGKFPVVAQRDLVLLPFPFSDQSGKKVRPVLIISNSKYNNASHDVIVLAVSSKIEGKFKVILTEDDFEKGNVKVKSCIRVDSILKISKSFVIKRIGRLNEAPFMEAIRILNFLIDVDH